MEKALTRMPQMNADFKAVFICGNPRNLRRKGVFW